MGCACDVEFVGFASIFVALSESSILLVDANARAAAVVAFCMVVG